MFKQFLQKRLQLKNTGYNKDNSRKYRLALMIFYASVLMCVVPPVLSVFILKIPALVILSGGEWITVISMLGGFYFGANVLQKKLIGDEDIQITNEPIKDQAKDKESNPTDK